MITLLPSLCSSKSRKSDFFLVGGKKRLFPQGIMEYYCPIAERGFFFYILNTRRVLIKLLPSLCSSKSRTSYFLVSGEKNYYSPAWV